MAQRPRPIAEEVARWASVRHFRPADIPTPGPGQESVWDYPRPPRLESVADALRIEHRGTQIAATMRAKRVCETASPPTYYVPRSDVQATLRRAAGASFCEWKGEASYWDVLVGQEVLARAAWSYPDPLEPYEALADHVCFYVAPFERCMVGDAVATPQPGRYYGGWVLPFMLGPFKGEPGSEAW